MDGKLDTRLEKVEPNRRDFMKKVAIGAAYAVPAMASFSLDSVRNKAFAQASYGPTPPRVVRLNVVDTSPDNLVVRVTFDQAMDTSIDPNPADPDGRIAKPVIECYDREWCFAYDNDPSHDTCEFTNFGSFWPPYSWRWGTNKEQFLTINLTTSGSTDNGYIPGIRIKYGKKPKEEGCIDFKGKNGLKLVPFEGRVDTFKPV